MTLQAPVSEAHVLRVLAAVEAGQETAGAVVTEADREIARRQVLGVSEPRRAKWSYDRGHGLTKGMGQTVSYRLRSLNGGPTKSGQARAEDVPAALLKGARAKLNAVTAVSVTVTGCPGPHERRRCVPALCHHLARITDREPWAPTSSTRCDSTASVGWSEVTVKA